ncbi:DMT family transporter [Phaeobacter inhibens]|uniref:DMT family transporter n=1 Tax=Phaeobacter inhibens TaxID=221822 RepID=UPI000C9ABE8A|nr:DMT family transporter [Phaeobacter inhibens]AUQ63355.1 putative permease, DMT superfamily [Phaeobacter inhibens]AUQ83261.1 putative permease, DMT superfamily [Phaeobacter inhibens]AUQ91020.1 putative permease, DMT superfamily [Phaeobacter inhibens]MDO6757309.1 DMT family transporter [Phaeobacter inhibens]
MRLIVLVSLTMVAFAANSILGRLAIGGGYMEATSFGLLRLFSGAVTLITLCVFSGLSLRRDLRQALWGAAALSIYIVGFSVAYQDLDAGLGALILFGVVQVSMFLWGACSGSPVSAGQIGGAGIALAGLAFVVWPTDGASVAPLGASLLMALGGLGWAAYSLLGRGARAPLAATAVNFAVATLMMVPGVMLFGGDIVFTRAGFFLAVLSGAVTSGLGYALWYHVLPQLSPAVAATVQLSVPVIAILAGAALLGEDIAVALVIGSAAVLGGIAIVVLSAPGRRAAARSKTVAER